MRKNKILSFLLVLTLLFVLVLNLAGCGGSSTPANTTATKATTASTSSTKTATEPSSESTPATEPSSGEISAVDLTAGFVPRLGGDSTEPVSSEAATAAADFAVRLFQKTYDGKNTLISPLSILTALAMATNGANGETKEEMEDALGMTTEELNAFFASYFERLPQNENAKLSLADSIWFRDDGRFSVRDEFLQTNADYYHAGAYRAPFDRGTVDDINAWVKEKTDGMIERLINGELSPDTMMILLNALAFDAKWAKPYVKEEQVSYDSFKKEDGTNVAATYLCDTELRYLADGENAVGFIKPYVGGRFAFAALLPNVGLSVGEYIATLDGAKLVGLLGNPQPAVVETGIPKFETRYETDLIKPLQNLGMSLAFTDFADFSGISETTSLYISRILHKTYIAVGEEGTRAAAVTAVMYDCLAAFVEDPPLRVILDRPFVYMLVDLETNVPLFIGVLNDPTD